MTKPIEMLVMVTGPQRAGKTTFITRLGLSKRLRAHYIGPEYSAMGWTMPKNDDRMCTDRLVCGKTVEEWGKKFTGAKLLICHSIRWRKYTKSEVLEQAQSLIDSAQRVVCILVYPDYLSLVNRVLENRLEALPTLPCSKTVYAQCKQEFEQFCSEKGIRLYVIAE